MHSHRTGRSLKVHWKRMCRVPSCLRLPRGPIPPWASQLPLTPHTLHYLCNSYSNAKAIIHGRTVPSTKVCLSAPAPGAIPSGFIIQIKEVLHAFFVCFFGNNLQAPPTPTLLVEFVPRKTLVSSLSLLCRGLWRVFSLCV